MKLVQFKDVLLLGRDVLSSQGVEGVGRTGQVEE